MWTKEEEKEFDNLLIRVVKHIFIGFIALISVVVYVTLKLSGVI